MASTHSNPLPPIPAPAASPARSSSNRPPSPSSSTTPAQKRGREDSPPPRATGSPEKYRKVDENARVVAQHYNARPEVGLSRRKESPILHLKNFNNWIKSILINKHARRGMFAMDLCCGKGGDLLKWGKAGIADLVGCDIADVSVDQARDRYKQGRGNRFRAEFFAADCFGELIGDRLPRGHMLDLVSCQFALHYSFETEEKARIGLTNITKNLKPGGFFIGTIPDANWIVKKLRNTEGLSFGNSVLTIKFEQKETYPEFGHKYWFELKDAIDNCPEYLLRFPAFVKLAGEYGLELVYKEKFHDLYQKESQNPQYRDLLTRMNVLNPEGTMSADEWEVAGLYMAFAFRKKG
ncbi:mRNA cap guanine-N7 methyltransferase [Geranomyces variabilis]|nr:mRNA cap guanine-N7 methyltransferase [Geranomyces variabilis]